MEDPIPQPPSQFDATALPTSVVTPIPHYSPRKIVAISPKRSIRDARFKRTSPRSGAVAANKDMSLSLKTNLKTNRPTVTGGKPLLPLSERRSQEDKAPARPVNDAETEKWDVAPDGSSAGREGRQFTVANVGNNGKIYLRPTVRPAHQRYPQPSFKFPMTPPSTAGLDALGSRIHFGEEGSELYESQWSPTPGQTPSPGADHYLLTPPAQIRPNRHRRALSDSTLQEVNASKESDAGAFKIVISKPGDDRRPKTTEDVNSHVFPRLDISIPTWRIGVPKFSATGTPLLRASSYAPSDDYSHLSLLDPSQRSFVTSPPMMGSRRPSTLKVPQARFSRTAMPLSPTFLSPTRALNPLRATYMSSRVLIQPGMFDDLTFKPACDDKLIVRYAPSTRAVTAATPSRLVAEITSPNFLDYELLSDFFLTFRAFLEPSDLLQMLVARLRWAVSRQDQIGMIVHVRSFVALRHWILNYFVDDFVVDYDLRTAFCTLVNGLTEEISEDLQGRHVPLKTLNELKKCWKRICDHYWDTQDIDEINAPVTPGGMAGRRDPGLDPTFWRLPDTTESLADTKPVIPKTAVGDASFYGNVPRAGHIGDTIIRGDQPMTPKDAPAEARDVMQDPTSPLSLNSMDVISCSFPARNVRTLPPNIGNPLAAHPVSPNIAQTPIADVATTPKALVGKRVRPDPEQQPNGVNTEPAEHKSLGQLSLKDQQFLMPTTFGGSLVRGHLLPPTHAFVDLAPPTRARGAQRQTTVFKPQVRGANDRSADMSSHGMRKLIGSVRRALSTRTPDTQGSLIGLSAFGPEATMSGYLSGLAPVPQSRSNNDGGRPPIRVDLLGAEAAEDFKRVVREAGLARGGIPKSPVSSTGELNLEPRLSDPDSRMWDSIPHGRDMRPGSEMGLTGGSQSIVIVDDTFLPKPSSSHQGDLPTANTSVEAFADAFLGGGANPTPPSTPPTLPPGESHRRSSHLLNEHVYSAMAEETLPPFVPDLTTLGGSNSVSPSENGPRRSISTSRRVSRHPPVSGGFARLHGRNKSSRTQRSLNSILHRRYASFSSDIVPPSTILSFDATTTNTRSSIVEDESKMTLPGPLRVLRRRPGGDLKAVSKIGDLDRHTLRRSYSLGSLSAYTESYRDSYLHAPPPRASIDDLRRKFRDQSEVFSVGQLADKSVKQEISPRSSRPSKPIMRPSFEAEAKKLAEIPDDEDDDGIEAALAKLEGKFAERRSAKLSLDLTSVQEPAAGDALVPPAVVEPEFRGLPAQDESPVDKQLFLKQLDGTDAASGAAGVLMNMTSQRPNAQSFLTDVSRESYSSIPLLDRGLTDEGQSKKGSGDWADRSIFQDSDDEEDNSPFDKRSHTKRLEEYSHLSFDFIHKTDSIGRIPPGETAPSMEQQSFLDSDLSSDVSDDATDVGNPVDGTTATPCPQPHERFKSAHQRNLSSSTKVFPQLIDPAPMAQYVAAAHDGGTLHLKPLPPTPLLTPGATPGLNDLGRTEMDFGLHIPEVQVSGNYTVHLPFILAFDSESLAQQFTLIEKDALNEIDWKELVDMDWKNTQTNKVRSWAAFLRNTEVSGVEIVIARFNIMVKWAVSEIVLTRHMEERARCIIKYIHIAAQCRRYRNFATMAQLAIALTSNEVSRLARTWELVPASDLKTLRDLETLVTPMRNFYNLRAEMEAGPETACIPFVGIYTHDLLYNAQRPSEIASSPSTAPLVNFERCRIAASIIKTLLRLLEASTRYDFQPAEGMTERCLWMAALTDQEIRRHSGNLE